MVKIKRCNKCGVILCEKNKYRNDRYTPKKCRACLFGFSSSRIEYKDLKLEEESILAAKIITDRLFRLKHKSYGAMQSKKYFKKYPERVRQAKRNSGEKLSDWFVRQMLIQQGLNDPSQLMIQVKRKQLKLKRLKKQWKSLTNKERLQLKV